MVEEEKTTTDKVTNDDETTTNTEDENTDTTESGEETLTIEETREMLAKMYLMFLDQQKGGILGTGAGMGVNLNPIQKDAIKYLTSESEEKKDILKTFFNNAKKKLVENVAGGTFVEYDKQKLSKMKALIIANKDNEAELTKLMEQIQNGVDPTENTQPDTTKDTKTDDEDKPTTDAKTETDTTDKVTHYASEYVNTEDIPTGKNVTEYLSLLTGGVVAETAAKAIIEKQLVSQEFMGTELKVNKYMAEALKEVEKDIKASDDEDLKKYVFTNMSTYNRRNVRGSDSLSYHALGLAIDIDPANNPMVQSERPKIVTNMPPALIEIFNKRGFIRGGNRGNNDREEGASFKSDAMHFEFKDIDYLTAAVEDTDNAKQAA